MYEVRLYQKGLQKKMTMITNDAEKEEEGYKRKDMHIHTCIIDVL
jgi:hypothetical protein